MRKLFAVQLIIEDTEPSKYALTCDEPFISDMKNTFFEDFPQYEIHSLDSSELCDGEAVRPLTVYDLSGDY